MKEGVLRNFTKFTGKHLCQPLFFNKVAGLRPTTLLKKRLWHRCFPMNFAKFLTDHLLVTASGVLQKGSLANFTKCTGKYLYQSTFLNKAEECRSVTLLKRDSMTPKLTASEQSRSTASGILSKNLPSLFQTHLVFLRKISALNRCLLKNGNIEIFFYLPM